jgi:hypothetical protein
MKQILLTLLRTEKMSEQPVETATPEAAPAAPVEQQAPEAAPEAPKETEAAIDPKMVVPETAEGYSLPVPEGDSGEFAKTASQWFHEAGIPPAQAEKLATKWNEFAAANQKAQADAVAAQEAQAEAKFKEEDASLRQEWGAKYDSNIELGKRAYREFGFTEEVVDAVEAKVGPAALFKIFANIGAKIGEDSAVGLNSSSGISYQSAATALYGDNKQ